MIEQIKNRYSVLITNEDSLSCGNTIQYVNVKEADICLDLGCGRGTDALKLAPLVWSEGFVFGVDITPEMIQKAKKNAEISNTKNVDFIVSPIEVLPFKTFTFDWVISNCALNHSQNKSQVWNEIFRVLKPHGQFVVSDIYAVNPISEEYSKNSQFIAECWAGAVTRDDYIDQIIDALSLLLPGLYVIKDAHIIMALFIYIKIINAGIT